MSSVSVEPPEILDSCFSNDGFNAATMGSECSLRAASRMSGDEPRPRSLRSSDFGQPVITVISVALQEASF
ncbi:hypothetical protein ACVWXN_006757 [Bradyrhizobium sp. i1.4.4]